MKLRRASLTELEKPGMAPVVVVSERFWRRRLGASRSAVGQTLRLNGRAATIFGVALEKFLGIWRAIPADVMVPVRRRVGTRTSGRPGTPIGAAEAALEIEARKL